MSCESRSRFDVRRELAARRVDLQDLEAIRGGGQRNLDDAIESARAANGGIEHVFAVRRGHPDDAVVAGHAVHLDEQLIERDFLFAGAVRASAASAERVELVDEDDAGRGVARLLRELAHAARSDADVHLVEVGARGDDHRAPGFAGDGAGEQRLAGAWRTDEQHALGAMRAHCEEALGSLEIGDDVAQVGLRFARAADVAEREMPRRGRGCEAIGAERATMVERVGDEQREHENEAAELDEALGGAGVRLDYANERSRCAPALEIGQRDGARRNDRLGGAHLPSIDSAWRAKREYQTSAVIGDGERGDLAGAQCLGGFRIGEACVAARPVGANRHANNTATTASTSAPAVQYWTGPRRSVIAENGRSFQLRRSRGGADWSFARRVVVMNYRRSALWGAPPVERHARHTERTENEWLP